MQLVGCSRTIALLAEVVQQEPISPACQATRVLIQWAPRTFRPQVPCFPDRKRSLTRLNGPTGETANREKTPAFEAPARQACFPVDESHIALKIAPMVHTTLS